MYLALGKVRVNATTFCWLKPGSTWFSRARLRTRSTAPTTRMIDSATSPATSTLRAQLVSRDVAVVRSVRPSVRDEVSAGRTPNSTGAQSDSAISNATTDQSRRRSAKSGTTDAGKAQEHDARAGHEREAERAADDGQDERFGDQLADETSATRAERAANRQLARAHGRPPQLQAGQVGANDQEQDRNRAAQHQQRRPRLEREAGMEVLQPHARLGVGVRVLLLEATSDRVHLLAGLRERYARRGGAR